MLLRTLLTSVCLLLPLHGQNLLIAPASHTGVEGSSSTNVPFGRSTPTRVQYFWDASLLPTPRSITAIAFRLDGGGSTAGKTVDVELRMSNTPLPLVALSADFASNRGANETIVLPRQLLNLPASTGTGTPSPFLPPIALATPFLHQPANGGLLLEVIVHGQPPGAYSLDATWVCSSPDVAIGPLSCPSAGGLPLRVESGTTQVIWGRPWTGRVLDAPPGALVVFGLGTTETGSWGGLNLPQEMTPFGAPGCWVSIDLASAFYTLAAGDGSAAFPFQVPNTPLVLGAWIRFQAAAFDPLANPLGLITSQAKKVQVCGFEPVGRVWSSGIGATSGNLEIGFGAVVQLTGQ
jgi:hypothetical protein